MSDCLARVVIFAPTGRLGRFFFEPGFELLRRHVDKLIELPDSALAGRSGFERSNRGILNDSFIVFDHCGQNWNMRRVIWWPSEEHLLYGSSVTVVIDFKQLQTYEWHKVPFVLIQYYVMTQFG